MGDGRYQVLPGRGALLPDAISTACSNITKKALPDAGMEQAGVSARACVPELLPVPSQGIKLDIPRRHRTAGPARANIPSLEVACLLPTVPVATPVPVARGNGSVT